MIQKAKLSKKGCNLQLKTESLKLVFNAQYWIRRNLSCKTTGFVRTYQVSKGLGLKMCSFSSSPFIPLYSSFERTWILWSYGKGKGVFTAMWKKNYILKILFPMLMRISSCHYEPCLHIPTQSVYKLIC